MKNLSFINLSFLILFLCGCSTTPPLRAEKFFQIETSPTDSFVFATSPGWGRYRYYGKSPLDTSLAYSHGYLVSPPKDFVLLVWKKGYLPEIKKYPFSGSIKEKFNLKEAHSLLSRKYFNIMAIGRHVNEMLEVFGRPNSSQQIGANTYLAFNALLTKSFRTFRSGTNY